MKSSFRVPFYCVVFFYLFFLQFACGGDSTVILPGCEECPERCLILKEGSSGKCVACLKDVHCQGKTSPTKKCTQDNKCICGSDKDCPQGQYCNGTRGCVECLNNEHCKTRNPDKPVCIVNRCEACEPNSSRVCFPDGSTPCKKGTQTCQANNTWGKCEGVLLCNSNQRCENEKCVLDCPPSPCKEGERKCTSADGVPPGSFQVCVKNTKGCLEWSPDKQCGVKDVCSKGQCSPYTCPPAECVEKDTKCDGNHGVKTCVRNPLGCLVWSKKQPCKSTEKCQKNLQKCALCDAKETRSCYNANPVTKGIGLCKAGLETCKDDGSGFSACVGEVKPAKEVCNGKDDDCDGVVDNGFTTVGQACNVGKGECAISGKFQCSKDGSKVECSVKAGTPSKEICDGKDNDCDGQTDEDFSNKGNSCTLGKGECSAKGVFVCKSDKSDTFCNAKTSPPTVEVCNGKDDDCDGLTDEGLSRKCYSGATGTKGVGLCKEGVQICSKGVWSTCTGEVTPVSEVCNGKDDNCDGQVDNKPSGINQPCTVAGKQGECSTGKTVCSAGKILCQQQVQPVKEICNKKDDDCDGKVDNGSTNTGSICQYCGNGVKEAGEQCDDKNTKPGDGCDSRCQLEVDGTSCADILKRNPASKDGIYNIDPDGSGPIQMVRLFCDMKKGGWTLVGNFYDSAGDDVPNQTSYVVSGWQQTASGKWSTSATLVDRKHGTGSSAAVSLAFVAALAKSAGQKNLKLCFVHQNGVDTVCRSSSDGSMTLVSYQSGNPKLRTYSSDKLTYTFGRLAGLAGSIDGYDYKKFKRKQSGTTAYCIPRTAGVKYRFGTDRVGACEYYRALHPWEGVWHMQGHGLSYKPWRKKDDELSCGTHPGANDQPEQFNPNLETYGFRLYIGPGFCGNGIVEAGEECDDKNTKNGDGCSSSCKAELGSKGKPAQSCLQILQSRATSPSGKYWLKLHSSLPAVEVFCDMKTDRGGWLKVLGISIKNNRYIGANPLGVIPGLAAAREMKGHVRGDELGKLKSYIHWKEIRFECYKPSVKRKIHIVSSNSAVIDFLLWKTDTQPRATGSFRVLADDTSVLSKSPALWGYLGRYRVDRWGHGGYPRKVRLFNHIMFISFSNHWIVGENPRRNECDDYSPRDQNGDWNIWVR